MENHNGFFDQPHPAPQRARLFAIRSFLLALAGWLVWNSVSPVKAQPRQDIWIENGCYRPIRVLILQTDGLNNHRPRGWFVIQQSMGIPLADVEVALPREGRRGILSYAETIDGGSMMVWEGRAASAMWQGVRYNFDESPGFVRDGRTVLQFSCPR